MLYTNNDGSSWPIRKLDGSLYEGPELKSDVLLETVNLGGLDLRGADLSSAHFYDVDFTGTDFRNANLSNAIFSDVTLTGVCLQESRLSQTEFLCVKSGGIDGVPRDLPKDYQVINGYLIGPYMDLRGAKLMGVDMAETCLTGTNLSQANLEGAYLRSAILYDSDLSQACLRGANLVYADLSECSLTEADLSRADMYCANLQGADLDSVNFVDAMHIATANFDMAMYEEGEAPLGLKPDDLQRLGISMNISDDDQTLG